MKQGLKHGIVSSSVENLVEDGVEITRFFFIDLILLLVSVNIL